MPDDLATDWTALGLGGIDSALAALLAPCRSVRLPPGQTVFRPGSPCEAYLLVLEGRVQVFLMGEEGREVVLYRVRPGESCVLTTAGLLGEQAYAVEGRTETAVTAMVIPRPVFDQALDQSAAFRRFVFRDMGRRLAAVMAQLEAIACQSLSHRLVSWLLDHCDPQGVVSATHEQVAREIGSVREVVSRELKRLERQGFLQRRRGSIRILESPR